MHTDRMQEVLGKPRGCIKFAVNLWCWSMLDTDVQVRQKAWQKKKSNDWDGK